MKMKILYEINYTSNPRSTRMLIEMQTEISTIWHSCKYIVLGMENPMQDIFSKGLEIQLEIKYTY